MYFIGSVELLKRNSAEHTHTPKSIVILHMTACDVEGECLQLRCDAIHYSGAICLLTYVLIITMFIRLVCSDNTTFNNFLPVKPE